MRARTIGALLIGSAMAMIAPVVLGGCATDDEELASTSASNLDGVTCTRDVMLHVRADTYFPRPDEYKGSTRFNGCWRFERPVQARWGKCDTFAPVIKAQPQTDRWLYDEVWQPKHGADDLAAIKTCHAAFGIGKGEAYAVWTGLGGYGDVGCPSGICLPDASGKRVDISPFIDRVWLEAYNDAAMAYYKAHKGLGRPMIDITDVADPYAKVKNLCDEDGALGIGVYIGPKASGDFTLDSFRMGQLIKAMNDCSGKGTPSTKPTASSSSSPPPPPPPPAPSASASASASTSSSSTPPPPPPPAPKSGGACTTKGAKACVDGNDLFIECDGAKWSQTYSCGVSYPGTTCKSGYCVGPQ